ncbi:general odorant-binding protein 1-like [Vanessa atalanta]|uniref:general odorant-binding protein 1-like n=1 Tax=Vanessa atalanta TaxID=42275 RepID=UPI001FCD7923|nr:general odorant-binding protein 1-like [Vanessa atalanta]
MLVANRDRLYQASMILWTAALVSVGNLIVVQGNVDVMKDVTLGFGEALQHCREESQLSEDKMDEFFHFWRDDFKFEDRELGCAIKCMSSHFNLLTDSHRMHHENTDKFIQSFPNGEVLSKLMVELIHKCEQHHDAESDHCWRILRVAECFKISCQAQGIAPTMELLMAEFIMETEAR